MAKLDSRIAGWIKSMVSSDKKKDILAIKVANLTLEKGDRVEFIKEDIPLPGQGTVPVGTIGIVDYVDAEGVAISLGAGGVEVPTNKIDEFLKKLSPVEKKADTNITIEKLIVSENGSVAFKELPEISDKQKLTVEKEEKTKAKDKVSPTPAPLPIMNNPLVDGGNVQLEGNPKAKPQGNEEVINSNTKEYEDVLNEFKKSAFYNDKVNSIKLGNLQLDIRDIVVAYLSDKQSAIVDEKGVAKGIIKEVGKSGAKELMAEEQVSNFLKKQYPGVEFRESELEEIEAQLKKVLKSKNPVKKSADTPNKQLVIDEIRAIGIYAEYITTGFIEAMAKKVSANLTQEEVDDIFTHKDKLFTVGGDDAYKIDKKDIKPEDPNTGYGGDRPFGVNVGPASGPMGLEASIEVDLDSKDGMFRVVKGNKVIRAFNDSILAISLKNRLNARPIEDWAKYRDAKKTKKVAEQPYSEVGDGYMRPYIYKAIPENPKQKQDLIKILMGKGIGYVIVGSVIKFGDGDKLNVTDEVKKSISDIGVNILGAGITSRDIADPTKTKVVDKKAAGGSFSYTFEDDNLIEIDGKYFYAEITVYCSHSYSKATMSSPAEYDCSMDNFEIDVLYETDKEGSITNKQVSVADKRKVIEYIDGKDFCEFCDGGNKSEINEEDPPESNDKDASKKSAKSEWYPDFEKGSKVEWIVEGEDPITNEKIPVGTKGEVVNVEGNVLEVKYGDKTTYFSHGIWEEYIKRVSSKLPKSARKITFIEAEQVEEAESNEVLLQTGSKIELEHEPTFKKVSEDIAKNGKLTITLQQFADSIRDDHVNEHGVQYYSNKIGLPNMERGLGEKKDVKEKSNPKPKSESAAPEVEEKKAEDFNNGQWPTSANSNQTGYNPGFYVKPRIGDK